MATNSISGDYGFVTQIPCILEEGNITVNSSAYGPFGKMTVCTFASEISKGDVVALSADPENTADATENNIVVTALANNVDLAIGRIIDEPKWVRQPTANQSTWADMLAAGYYRIANMRENYSDQDTITEKITRIHKLSPSLSSYIVGTVLKNESEDRRGIN